MEQMNFNFWDEPEWMSYKCLRCKKGFTLQELEKGYYCITKWKGKSGITHFGSCSS